MECKEVRASLKTFLEDLLEEGKYQAFQAHLAGCPACEGHARMFGGFTNDFRELSHIPIPEGMADEVMELLGGKKIGKKARHSSLVRNIVIAVVALAVIGDLVMRFAVKPVKQNLAKIKQADQDETKLEDFKFQGVESKVHDWEKPDAAPAEEKKPAVDPEQAAAAAAKREQEELAKIKKKLQEEKEGKEAKAEVPIPVVMDLGKEAVKKAPKIIEEQTQMAPSPSEISEPSGASPSAGGTPVSASHPSPTAYQWDVVLPSRSAKDQLIQSLNQAGASIHYSQGEFVIFSVPASRVKELAEAVSYLPGLSMELQNISTENVPDSALLRISLVLLISEKK